MSPSFPIPTHGILGKDFLCDNDSIIEAFKNELTVRILGEEINIPMLEPRINFITVPPRCQIIRKISIEATEDVVVEKTEVTPGVFVAGSISSTDKTFVSILNVTDVTQRLNVTDIKFTPLGLFTAQN